MRRWQTQPDTALAQSLSGQVWSVTDQLLALIYDVLSVANWQRNKKRSSPRPKPLPRPWEKTKSTSLGKDPIAIADFDDWWDSRSRK